jgi:uncharacterized protein (TIGR02301 family)
VIRRALLALLLAAAMADPAHAQERTPAERQTLVELAYVIGESHALRQACAGPGDQYWRTRMQQLVAAEQPDAPFARRLTDSFNDGFMAGRQGFPTCTARTRQEAARVAQKGRELSVTLTGSVADDASTR